MEEAGYAALAIIPSFDGFESKLQQGTTVSMAKAGAVGGDQFGTAAGRSAGSRFGRVFSAAAKTALAGGVIASALAVKLGKESIAEASDLQESLNAVNVSYDKQSRAVKRLGRESADALGLSNTEFNSLAVRFSSFSEQIAGGKGKKVVTTLDDLTTRAADFASVMNLDVAEAAELFQSGLAGETEPLRRFGLDMSAAAVQAHAYKTGLAEAGSELTEQEKVQARYSLLMKQTADAQGDFANTSDSLANRQRILSANVDNLQAKLGKALLPVTEEFVGFLVDRGVPAVERFSDWFIDKGIPGLADFREEIAPLAKDLVPALGDAFDTVRDAVEGAVPFVKDLIEGFNDLPPEVKKGLLIGGGLYAGGKILGGRNGGSGVPSLGPMGLLGATKGAVVTKSGELLADRLLAKFQKPLPVIVTNPGFGARKDGSGAYVADTDRDKDKRRNRGAGSKGAVGVLLAGIFGDDFVNEVKAEATYPWTKGPFAPAPNTKQSAAEVRASMAQIEQGFDQSVTQNLQGIPDAARAAVNQAAVIFAAADLPAALKTQIALTGVPESRKAVKDLIAQYDLTPREKKTAFEILGYDLVLDRAERINRAYDYAARDRRMRISVEYENEGYETRGGLQRGGGTTTTQTGRSRAGGGLG